MTSCRATLQIQGDDLKLHGSTASRQGAIVATSNFFGALTMSRIVNVPMLS
jgi:hypothetical protein